MGLPTIQKIWTISPNNRITYVSLNDTMARYLFGVKEFLKANGYTVRGSSDGATGTMTGGMDLVDRWLTFAHVTTRGASAAAVQSWIVLRDGNGVDILITYQGAGTPPTGDDIARISFSPNQLFVAAGTPTHQPTATDEVVVTSAATLIGTGSGDRIWNGWVDSMSKLCRFAVMRAGVWVGNLWGIEEYDSAMLLPAAPDPSTRPVWGFGLVPTTSHLSTGTQCGQGRCITHAGFFTMSLKFGCEFMANSPTQFANLRCELQGFEYQLVPLAIGSHTASARGKAGDLYDWWLGRTTGGADGDTYGALEFIGMAGVQGGNVGGHLWPWDGVSTPLRY